jgi:hypothetical protein
MGEPLRVLGSTPNSLLIGHVLKQSNELDAG